MSSDPNQRSGRRLQRRIGSSAAPNIITDVGHYQGSARVQAWIGSNPSGNPFEDPSDDFDRLTMSGSEMAEGATAQGGGDLISLKDYPENFWDQVTNKGLQPEDMSQWLMKLERGEDKKISQSYFRAKRIGWDKMAPIPSVGLVFLPGADRPSVNRLEETNMSEKQPDQRDSVWRVGTAGSLLSDWTVNNDLSFKTSDNTEKVVENMNPRIQDEKGQKRLRVPDFKDTITIDSERVKIVHMLRDELRRIPYDLSATLIEVDFSSLVRLISNFKTLVSQGSQALSHDREQLEKMMEDAKFFCVRSPILFRMATRDRIIDASDIRYGTDSETGFQTVYTSKGIQQLISVSAGYYNSLDPASRGPNDAMQHSVKPRFLQTLCLLLSMLSNYDLTQQEDFLSSTYNIKASRPDLELMFLKVLPLASINSKVFLNSLIPAVTGYWLSKDFFRDLGSEGACWDQFMRHLAERGYLLPATVDTLRRSEYSWLTEWPEDGIRSSHVFGRLQLDGKSAKGFNEISPVKVGIEPDEKEITVYLGTNKEAYSIAASDFEHINCLDEGDYLLQDPKGGGRLCTLRVRPSVINDEINAAIRLINRALPSVNAEVARTGSRGFVNSIIRRPSASGPQIIAGDLPQMPVITRHEAWLEDEAGPLAVAWKCGGKLTSRLAIVRLMGSEVNRVRAFVNRYLRGSRGNMRGQHDEYYRRVMSLLHTTEEAIERERSSRLAADTPISKSVPSGDNPGLLGAVWYEYNSRFDPRSNYLSIYAQRDLIKSVHWIQANGQAEIALARIPTRFIITVLRPDLGIPRDDEVQPGDVVLLAGRYMIIAKVAHKFPPVGVPVGGGREEQMYEMMNWLEILSCDEKQQSWRDRGRGATERPLSVFV